MLIEHHLKYKEIDGYDETIWITNSEHLKLHHHKGGGWSHIKQDPDIKIPRDISIKAHKRTKKYKAAQQYYMKDYNPEYREKNIRTKRFLLTVEPNSYIRICIELNTKTDKITVYNQIEKKRPYEPKS